MRAKLKLVKIDISESMETLHFRAVGPEQYEAGGADENNTFARYTPSADLYMSVTNPDLLGTFREGDVYYVDFTKAN